MKSAPMDGRGARNSDVDGEEATVDAFLSTSEAPHTQATKRIHRRRGGLSPLRGKASLNQAVSAAIS